MYRPLPPADPRRNFDPLLNRRACASRPLDRAPAGRDQRNQGFRARLEHAFHHPRLHPEWRAWSVRLVGIRPGQQVEPGGPPGLSSSGCGSGRDRVRRPAPGRAGRHAPATPPHRPRHAGETATPGSRQRSPSRPVSGSLALKPGPGFALRGQGPGRLRNILHSASPTLRPSSARSA